MIKYYKKYYLFKKKPKADKKLKFVSRECYECGAKFSLMTVENKIK
jgi:hypothetical protein